MRTREQDEKARSEVEVTRKETSSKVCRLRALDEIRSLIQTHKCGMSV